MNRFARIAIWSLLSVFVLAAPALAADGSPLIEFSGAIGAGLVVLGAAFGMTRDLVERQRILFLAMIRSLVSALEAKDQYTRDHSSRVTDISLEIGRHFGLKERELHDPEMAAVLHDIGKIALPENILNKAGKLTDDEMAQMLKHPVIGETILKPVVELETITKMVRSHHERYDGSGYPDRLKGLAIPLGARIMAVADAYDAITSTRPYRRAGTHSFAVKEITRSSGSQFDPEVVEHFLDIAEGLPSLGRSVQ